jgi:hypothetical protein
MLSRFAFSLSLSVATMLGAQAQTVDPLWKKAVANFEASKKFAATDIHFELDQVNDGKTKRLVTTSQLRAWDRTKPVYTVLKTVRTPDEGDNGKPFDLEVFARVSDALIVESATVRRLGGQKLNGKPVVVFVGSEGKSPQKAGFRIAVDPTTGALQRIESDLYVFGTFDGKIDTRYKRDGSGASFPETIEAKFDVPEGKMVIRQKATNWVARPLQ